MKAIKITAALTAMALLIGAAGCSGKSGGKDSEESGDIEESFESYMSKVLAGKDASGLIDSGSESGYDLYDYQKDVLVAVMDEATYKVKSSDTNDKKGEGSVEFEIKYPDAEYFAEDYDFEDREDFDDIIDDIKDADSDEYRTDKFTLDFILDDGEWLVTEDSDREFKSFLSGIVATVGSAGTPAPTGSGDVTETTVKDTDSFTITPSEVSLITYETYEDPSGYFTMQIPEGWAVSTGLIPTGEVDLISYAIRMYDPDNPDRMLYFNLNNAGMIKSGEAHDWYVDNYGADNPFALMPVATELSAKGYFEGACNYYYYTSFDLIENVGQNVLGGDVLNATVTSSITGQTVEGLFSVTLMNFEYYVQKNMFDYTQGTVDVGYLIPYDVVMETAPEGEFVDWQPVLDYCFGTIKFTDAFMTQRQQQWNSVMATSEYIMNTANEINDMIMDTWENSSRAYDVASQKNSDATLGYERVYDTETGEYYRAETGFGDWYDGTRYEVVDTDEAYLSPISGTIDWKG